MNRLSDIQQKFGTSILESFTKKTSSKKKEEIVKDFNNFFDAFNVVAEYILENHYTTSLILDKKFGKMTRYICSLKKDLPLFKRNLEFEYFTNDFVDTEYVKLNASCIYELHLIKKDNTNFKILCLCDADDDSVKEKGLDKECIGYCALDFKKDLTPLQRTRIAVTLSSGNLKESFVGKTHRKKTSDISQNSEEPFDIFKTVAEYIIANSFENTYDDEWEEGDFDCYVKDWENCDIIRKDLSFEFIDKIGQVNLDGIGPYKLRLFVSDGEYKNIRCFFSPLESDARKKHIDTDRLGENDDTDFMEDLTNEERLKIAKFLGCFSELHESFTKKTIRKKSSTLTDEANNEMFQINDFDQMGEYLEKFLEETCQAEKLNDVGHESWKTYRGYASKSTEESREYFENLNRHKLLKFIQGRNKIFFYVNKNYEGHYEHIYIFLPIQVKNRPNYLQLMIDACYDYKDAEKLMYKRQIELLNARFISGFDSNIAITGLNNEGDFEIYPMKRKILTDNELIKMKVNFTLMKKLNSMIKKIFLDPQKVTKIYEDNYNDIIARDYNNLWSDIDMLIKE